MNLYLQRHGEPKPGDKLDVSRELSDLGVKQVEQMAAFMVRQVGRVDTVITSPYVCAMQTAAIMAKTLGSPVIADTRMLQPENSGIDAWDEIERLAQQAGDVLVVTHFDMVQAIIGNEDTQFVVEHGSVAFLKGYELGWFVTPQIVARDEAETEVLEAARELAEHLNTKPRAAIVDPLIAKLQAVTAGRFRAQKKHVLKALELAKPHLEEAAKPSQTVPPIVHHAVTAALASFAFPRFATVFTSTTGQAHEGGLAEGADMIGFESEEVYDRTAGMLAGELDQTTEERIGDALRDVFGLGKGYDGLVEAVSGVFDDAIASRAVTTGESEISAAWNKGVADAAQSATDAGQNIEKRWSAEDDACEEICQPNADQDWIDNDDLFDSGDDQPPGHPNCRCSLELRAAKG